MIDIYSYIRNFNNAFRIEGLKPWKISADLEKMLLELIGNLPSNYTISGNVAIHKTATIEQGCVLKGPIIIGPECLIGAHAYLRGGVFLEDRVVVGPGCEMKSSIIHKGSALAHFNFVGNSILGANVNMEAGSVIANHFNERDDKTIFVRINDRIEATDATKFGALIGDGCKIGANAVLSPGTLLKPDTVVKRLELIDQCNDQ